jgi:hypothetical protein
MGEARDDEAMTIRATFGIVLELPSVETSAPDEDVGLFLMTAPHDSTSWIFEELLPQLEQVCDGRRESVTASSELVDLKAFAGEVELSQWDFDPPKYHVVPLRDFIEVVRLWRDHVGRVRGGHQDQS